ncbi:haloacid dehalogenase [Paenibacillus swuensis]|uniref:Haloacid dehalogenase n=1 Tax=Paenibacillus swuensis TaxID=1178515 RepID=A0A172TNI2_9BACL|nr:HAD-IIA family hydrolase [Paenibacillus swuensis]ANE48377.1 haloacid dehalogenase [Paenibacillus swuensis]
MRADIQGYIIDLDGTVYRGKHLIKGADAAIAHMKSQGKKVVFLSNRGNISREMCHAKLLAMGLDIAAEDILLTSTVTGMYLSQEHSGRPVWVLGEQGLKDELRTHGIPIAGKPEDAAWLVITLHETLTYAELNDAFRAVRHGAGIIATNGDRMFPGDDGDSIDVAGMIGAITYATGVEPEVVIGKPSRRMAEAALAVLGLPAGQCMVIGDSLTSDIALGKQSGMATALVLTGSATREDAAASEWQPDVVVASLLDIIHL